MSPPKLKQLLQETYNESTRKSHHPFPIFMRKLESVSLKPATNLIELRQKNNKKIIGDLFEEFCFLYFSVVKKYDQVWMFKDLPEPIKKSLGLPKNDMGIDLVIKDKDKYSAVQVKYRKKSKNPNILSWKELSTFYASCLKTGPWNKRIVFTNCDYIRHVGKKNKQDLSICFGTLRNLIPLDFLGMVEALKTNHKSEFGRTLEILEKEKTEEMKKKMINQEEMRIRRLIYFDAL